MANDIGVRLPAEWMTAVDDRILEYLTSEGVSAVKKIATSGKIEYSRPTVNLRLRMLTEMGLVKDYDNGVYGITERGEEYLRGENDLRSASPPEALEHIR